jgi:crotonobetaine/carnitine-CoA ligase
LPSVELIHNDLEGLRNLVIYPSAEAVGKADYLRNFNVVLFKNLMNYPDDPLKICVSQKDLSCIMCTSGTSGPSKGVMLIRECNVLEAEYTKNRLGYTSDDVIYSAFPMTHAMSKYCTILAALVSGAQVVLEDRFGASKFYDIIRQYGVTAFGYMGAMINML